MSESRLSIWTRVGAPRVDLEARPARDGKRLEIAYAVTNTATDSILVFRQDPPWIRLAKGKPVLFLSAMPQLTPWLRVIVPAIPPVVRLAPGESFAGEASFDLPLRDTHPYPAAQLSRVPVPTQPGRIRSLQLVIGWFPESDGNKLYDQPGTREKIPSYYDLKRQLLAGSRTIELELPAEVPLWGR